MFDLPWPLFAWIDARAGAVASPAFRLVLWGVLAAVVSLFIYQRLSAQERIRRGRIDIAEAKRQLDGYEGEWDQAQDLLRRLLRLSFAQVGRVGWPTIVASLPVLSLLAWLSTSYGYRYPMPGEAPTIRTEPAGLEAQWRTGECVSARASGKCPHIVVHDGARPLADVELSAPVRILHKRRWWNVLLGNPAGYLPPDLALEAIHIELPAREYLSLGPRWSRTWGALFFVPLIITSLVFKRWRRIA